MDNYIQITFSNLKADEPEILIAVLSDLNYSGFEETENGLLAYIKETDFDSERLKWIAEHYQMHYSTALVEAQNWNALWESNFEPVVVNDFVAVRANFHPPFKDVRHEIIITPKMSFGTGHHATTWMMMNEMSALDFKNKTVFDFGTGTGILAILAEKLGASNIVAIDYDEWCIANSLENIEKNNCACIELLKADSAAMNRKFDIILANINKNVILDNAALLVQQLNPDGILLLSGLLNEDEAEILSNVYLSSLQHSSTNRKAQWIEMSFKKGN